MPSTRSTTTSPNRVRPSAAASATTAISANSSATTALAQSAATAVPINGADNRRHASLW